MVSEVFWAFWHLSSVGGHAWTHRRCLVDDYSTPLAILFLLIIPNHPNCLPKQAEEICLSVFWPFAFLVGLEGCLILASSDIAFTQNYKQKLESELSTTFIHLTFVFPCFNTNALLVFFIKTCRVF